MSDLIDRQAAIEDIRTMIPKDARLDIKWVEMWLMQLPSVQPDNSACWVCNCPKMEQKTFSEMWRQKDGAIFTEE